MYTTAIDVVAVVVVEINSIQCGAVIARTQRHNFKTRTDTDPITYRSQQCHIRSCLRAGKIKGVVKVYNKTMKRSCFIIFISHRNKICMKLFNNGAQSQCLF